MQVWVLQIPSIPILVSVVFPSECIELRARSSSPQLFTPLNLLCVFFFIIEMQQQSSNSHVVDDKSASTVEPDANDSDNEGMNSLHVHV